MRAKVGLRRTRRYDSEDQRIVEKNLDALEDLAEAG